MLLFPKRCHVSNDDKKRKPGLKINNDRSMAKTLSKPPSKKEFEETAKQVNETLNSYNDRAAKLASDFRKLMEDTTLIENKNVLMVDIEREILGKLAQLAVDINTDEHEKEGMGSVGLLAIVFNHLLLMRDRINLLEYRLEQEIKKSKIISTAAHLDKQIVGQ